MVTAKLLIFGLLASCAFGHAASAQQPSQPPNSAAKASIQAAVSAVRDTDMMAGELEAYGVWLMQVNTVSAPAFEEMREMQGEWARTMTSRTPAASINAFHQYLDRARAIVDGARTELATMETPVFSSLDLPGDLQPPEVRRQMIVTLTQMDQLIVGFRPLLNSIVSRDQAAAQRASANIFRSARTLYDSQHLFARAALATTEPETIDYHAAEFEVLFFEAGGRLIDAGERLMNSEGDAAVAWDLLRIADEIDRVTAAGIAAARSAKADAESQAAVEGAGAQQIIDRANRIDALSIEYFATWRRYSGGIRAAATAMQGGPLTFARLQPALQLIGPTRAELDAISLRQLEILSGTR